MLFIEEYCYIDRPHTVRVSFNMSYPDWCKFQKTYVYSLLIRYLKALERKGAEHER